MSREITIPEGMEELHEHFGDALLRQHPIEYLKKHDIFKVSDLPKCIVCRRISKDMRQERNQS